MSMPSIYDTPPDGDFARYVETLGHQSAAHLLQQQGAGAPTSGKQRTAPRTAQPAPANAAPVTGARPFAPLRKMLNLGFVLWIAYSVGAALFPPLAFIGWPLLIVFVVVAAARLKALPWADLAQAARSEAEQKIKRPSRPK